MRIKISPVKDSRELEKMYPNMIYNRFDLFEDGLGYEAVRIRAGKEERIVEYRVNGEQAELGIWLMPITAEELDQLFLYIHDHHPTVKKILYKNALVPCGKKKKHNHYRIVFPETVEEMEQRISPKSRAKMRRRNRRAEEKYGKMTLIEYENGNIPEEVVEEFFRCKLATRGRVYNMTAKEYLKRYHVTDCYVVKFGDTMGAMHFCCEQGPVVYGENHSYNPELLEYSLGKFIFAHSLIRMAEKKRTEIFLAGGDYEYKTHYGSIEEILYDCTVNVSGLDLDAIRASQSPKRLLKEALKAHLPEKAVTALRSLKARLKR